MEELKDLIFTTSTESNRYSCLFGSEGKQYDWVELDTILSVTDTNALAIAILELALLEVKTNRSSYADLENWLDEIQIKDNKLYWKFPIYN